MTTLKGPGKPQTYDGSGLRIGIVHARWNSTMIDALLEGAKSSLRKAGVKDENVVVQSVAGSWELVMGVKGLYNMSQVQSSASGITTVTGAVADLMGSTSDLTSLSISSPTPSSTTPNTNPKPLTTAFDAIIAIGVLIKGETMHFEYIADAVSHGLMRLQMEDNVPVVFGLLTVLTEEQGLARAGMAGKGGDEGHNHGEDWGSAAVEMGVKRRGWVGGEVVE